MRDVDFPQILLIMFSTAFINTYMKWGIRTKTSFIHPILLI